MDINVTLGEALGRASDSLRKKMLHSVELLRKAEKIANIYDKENGYYLAFSGGKDSQALFHIAQLAGVKFKAHMNFTSVDPPEVIRFVRQSYPEVETIKPRKSIYQIAEHKKFLPSMIVRWCCAEVQRRCWRREGDTHRHTPYGKRTKKETERNRNHPQEIQW